jgi:hypothetical protein
MNYEFGGNKYNTKDNIYYYLFLTLAVTFFIKIISLLIFKPVYFLYVLLPDQYFFVCLPVQAVNQ